MLISIVIIVGAASGVIVFNFILVTWCLFCQRKQLGAKVELRPMTLQKRSSLLKGKRVKFAPSVSDSRNKYTSYPASRPSPHVPSPLATAKVRIRRSSDRPPVKNLFPQQLPTITTLPPIVNRALSVRSNDTASVYSAASAPLEIHDQLLRSHNSPNIIPVISASSPSEILNKTKTSLKDADVTFLPCAGNRLSVMEEGLDAAYNHPRHADHEWRQQSYCEMSPGQSVWSQTSNLPPGLLVSPRSNPENIGLPSTPTLPSPYSPPSKW